MVFAFIMIYLDRHSLMTKGFLGKEKTLIRKTDNYRVFNGI